MKSSLSNFLLISIVLSTTLLQSNFCQITNDFKIQEIEPEYNPERITSPEMDDDFPSIKKIDTPGNFLVKGFFSHDTMVNLDSNGTVYEWENYNDMRYQPWQSNYVRFRIDSAYPTTWPDQPNT